MVGRIFCKKETTKTGWEKLFYSAVLINGRSNAYQVIIGIGEFESVNPLRAFKILSIPARVNISGPLRCHQSISYEKCEKSKIPLGGVDACLTQAAMDRSGSRNSEETYGNRPRSSYYIFLIGFIL